MAQEFNIDSVSYIQVAGSEGASDDFIAVDDTSVPNDPTDDHSFSPFIDYGFLLTGVSIGIVRISGFDVGLDSFSIRIPTSGGGSIDIDDIQLNHNISISYYGDTNYTSVDQEDFLLDSLANYPFDGLTQEILDEAASFGIEEDTALLEYFNQSTGTLTLFVFEGVSVADITIPSLQWDGTETADTLESILGVDADGERLPATTKISGISFNMYGGDDIVNFSSFEFFSFSYNSDKSFENIIVELGSGDDFLNIGDNEFRGVTAYGGAGADSIFVEANPFFSVVEDLTIYGGAGNDIFEVGVSQLIGAPSGVGLSGTNLLHGGSGDDSFELEFAQLEGLPEIAMTVNGGAGTDSILLNLNAIEDDLSDIVVGDFEIGSDSFSIRDYIISSDRGVIEELSFTAEDESEGVADDSSLNFREWSENDSGQLEFHVGDVRGEVSTTIIFANLTLDDVVGPTVNGTSGNDVIDASYIDADGDRLTSGSNTVIVGTGNDTVDFGSDDSVDTLVISDGDGRTTILSGGTGEFNNAISSFTVPDIDGNGNLLNTPDQLDVSGLTNANGDPITTADVDVARSASGIVTLSFPNGASIVFEGRNAGYVFWDPRKWQPALEAIGIPRPDGDGIVRGTNGDDYMNLFYHDADGDFIDAYDAQDGIGIEGSNDDSILAGAGNDEIYGANGNDTIHGGSGNDYIEAGNGNNSIIGGAGDDTFMDFDSGNDIINMGSGNDRVIIDEAGGSLFVKLGNGNDRFEGYSDDAGSHTVYGGKGDDTLQGLQGDDKLYGGADNDEIYGGQGNDLLHGGGGTGIDLIYGGAGEDVLRGSGGDDILYGGADNDRIIAGDGNDLLEGGSGEDRLRGNAGEDSLLGGEGHDNMAGGLDNDTLYGGAGDDRLKGNEGSDQLMDGTGTDRMWGGEGADIFVFIDDGEYDRLLDFNVLEDRIDISDFGVTYGDLIFRDLSNARVRIDIGDDRFLIRDGDGTPDLTSGELTESVFIF